MKNSGASLNAYYEVDFAERVSIQDTCDPHMECYSEIQHEILSYLISYIIDRISWRNTFTITQKDIHSGKNAESTTGQMASRSDRSQGHRSQSSRWKFGDIQEALRCMYLDGDPLVGKFSFAYGPHKHFSHLEKPS